MQKLVARQCANAHDSTGSFGRKTEIRPIAMPNFHPLNSTGQHSVFFGFLTDGGDMPRGLSISGCLGVMANHVCRQSPKR